MSSAGVRIARSCANYVALTARLLESLAAADPMLVLAADHSGSWRARVAISHNPAADLVLADSWEVSKAVAGSDTSAHVRRLQWTLEHHVILRRARAPFTHVEHNRTSALLALMAALAEVNNESYGWFQSLPNGADISIRLGRPENVDEVAAMHARCSQESIYQRYFTPMNCWREENLRRISGGHRGATLVATSDSGSGIALGNVFPIGPDGTSKAELADNKVMLKSLSGTRFSWVKSPAADIGAAVVSLWVRIQLSESFQGIPDRHQFRGGFGKLSLWMRAGDNSAAGEGSHGISRGVDFSAAQGDTELTVTLGIKPPNRSGVSAPIHAF